VVFRVAASLGVAAALYACSSSEKQDAPTDTPLPCEASNTCGAGGGTSLPPIMDPQFVPGPCTNGKCTSEAGVYDGSLAPLEDAAGSEGAVKMPDAGAVDASDASSLTDGGPG